MPDTVLAILLALTAIIGSTIFHLEALGLIDRYSRWSAHRYFLVPGLVLAVVATHLTEIGFYTAIYYVADRVFDIGDFVGKDKGLGHLFFFAAETYASLGLEGTAPNGMLRLIVSIGSLNGVLLLTWSGTFLCNFASRLHEADR
jgi:hypothetical protein